MPDLALILTTGEPLKENLKLALDQQGAKPWAFNEFKRQMQGITPGSFVCWLQLVDEHDQQVNRFTKSDAVVRSTQLVLGQTTTSVKVTAAPFFDGYPHQFAFDLVKRDDFASPIDLETVVELLNDAIPGLALQVDQIQALINYAKTSKVGMFTDGAPRPAAYFPALEKKATPSPPPTLFAPIAAPTAIPAGSDIGRAISNFRKAVDAAGLVFAGLNADLPATFLAGLAAKPFVILTGLSGSGKTAIARGLGQWLGQDDTGEPRYLVVPVRADWTSPEPLLGYEDALLPPHGGRRAWAVPDALEFTLRASRDNGHLWLLVLDEMNLAYVERYFADVLSGIESHETMLPNLARDPDGLWRPAHGGHAKIPLPTNLLIVGTVNVDETTFQLSPKVLDRAFSFEFRVSTEELGAVTRRPTPIPAADPGDIEAFRAVMTDENWHIDHPAASTELVTEQLVDLHRRLTEIGLEFGHRTFLEAVRFTATLDAAGIGDPETALDWIVMTKVLPRIHGSRGQLEVFLSDLVRTATGDDPEKPVWPLTARKATRMLDLVRANQFVSFAE